MKKAISLILAVALCLSLGLAAGAAGPISFPDVAADNPYAPAIGLLSSLSVVAGDESGFRPADNIKRSEFCKIAYVIYTGSPDASAYTKASQFTDVADNAWYNGYVNWAAAKGIVGGMGDGTFAPDANVTIEQIIKMLVVAIAGAPANPVWPDTYLQMAQSTDLCLGVTYTATNVPATREQVAQFGCNAIFESSVLLSATPNDKYFNAVNPMAGGPTETKLLLGTYTKSFVDVDTKLHMITAPDNIGLGSYTEPTYLDTAYSVVEVKYTGPSIDHLVGQIVKVTYTDDTKKQAVSVKPMPNTVTYMASELSFTAGVGEGAANVYYAGGAEIKLVENFFKTHKALYLGVGTTTWYSASEAMVFGANTDDFTVFSDADGDGVYDFACFNYSLNGVKIVSIDAEAKKVVIDGPTVGSYSYIGATTLDVENTVGLEVGDYVDMTYRREASKGMRVHNLTKATYYENAVLEALTDGAATFKLSDGSKITAPITNQTVPSNAADTAARAALIASNAGKTFAVVIVDKAGTIVKAVLA